MLQNAFTGRTAPHGPAVLNLGFRPFFLGAAVFSVLIIVAWTLVYSFSFRVPLNALAPFQWHAHEMIYGYSLAVIAGFLLTAVRNWTGVDTARGAPLLVLFGLWAAARVAMLFGTAFIVAAAVFDMLFIAVLVGAVASPIVRVRMWKQLGILSKLILLGAGGLVFYLGLFGVLDSGVYWGIYGGLYLVVGLVMTMGRRIIPAFIQSGVGYPVTLFNSKWIDRVSLLLFLVLFLFELFVRDPQWSAYPAAGLFIANLIRLGGWHTPGIWKKPLLWSLYVAYAFVVLGFLLLALSGFAGASKYLAVHSFAYGGIGIITLSMMVRVSLGHTGRDVHNPPAIAFHALLVLTAGALLRVLAPLVAPAFYMEWVVVSQLMWVFAFALLVAILLPVLTRPRVDGAPG